MIKHLGQIDHQTMKSWPDQFTKRNGDFFCKKCGSQIGWVTCYVSIHLKIFEPECVGPGKVIKVNYPFCPKCDEGLEYVTACYHIDTGVTEPRLLTDG